MERFSGFGIQRWKVEDEQCLVILTVSLKREREKKKKSIWYTGCPAAWQHVQMNPKKKKKKQREA
jgi:hypothetical protein